MKGRLLVILALLVVSDWSHQVYNSNQQLNWLAHQGNPKAQYQLANNHWQDENRTAAHYWWQRAADQQYFPAIESLLTQFPEANDNWLKLAAAAGDVAAKREVAMTELNSSGVSLDQWQRRWGNTDEPWVKQQFELLNLYQQKSKSCEMRIKVVAADSSEKKRYLNFLSAVKNSPFESDNWCVSWVLDENLSCISHHERNRASCQSVKEFNRQVILADEGIASADNRTLTLTPDSSELVIQHELGHWLGFADEYPMSEPLARQFCGGHYNHQSLNIIVTEHDHQYSGEQVRDIYQSLPWKSEIQSWQDIAVQVGDTWRLGSSGSSAIGLFKADTCNAISDRQAWRPVNVSTAMEQHDTGRWPEVYLKLLRKSQ